MFIKNNSVFIFIYIIIFNFIGNKSLRNLYTYYDYTYDDYDYDDDNTSSNSKLTATEGIIIYVVLLIIFIGLIIFCVFCCRRRRVIPSTVTTTQPRGYYVVPVGQAPVQSNQYVYAVPQQSNIPINGQGINNNNVNQNQIPNNINSNQILNLNANSTDTSLAKINYLFQYIMIPEIYNERLQNLESQCTICLIKFVLKKSKIVETKCHHIFHYYCLKKCLLNAAEKKCPNCNYDFFSLFTNAVNLKINEIKIEPLDERDNPNNDDKNL
jgi:hypothetical protein